MTIGDRVLVLMPTVKDGMRTQKALVEAGFECIVCKDLPQLCAEISVGAGTALVTEEFILADRERYLQRVLQSQPTWSDFPLVVLAREASEGAELRESMNATLVERPVKLRSLLSVVRAALRSRRHQYEIRDYIAEREKHALELRAGEESLRRMINVEGIGVLVWKLPEGHLLSSNDFFLRMFGYTAEDLKSKQLTWRDMTPPEYIAASEEQLKGFAKTGRIGPYEKEYYRKDGSRAWMVFVGAALDDERAVEYCIDIGDRKRAEQDKEKLLAQLKKLDRRKDEFIATLAHELRNPLAPIRNGLQVMRLAPEDTAAVSQSRLMMERQLTHMVRLIDDLLDMSRISRNKIELRTEKILIADVISSAVETTQPLIDAAGLELSVSLPPKPVFLNADFTRLAQVFSNLLTNSAKYTERGGKIELTAKVRHGELTVTVRDTGIGIPADSLPTIFEMFSQVDRSIERSSGGLGIGLALVRGLVELHGGTVAAESPGPGKGSTLTVKLPVTEGRSIDHGSPESDNGSHGPGRRVLVVDDNEDAAASMAMMLRVLGDDVKIVHDGIAAIDAAETFRPEVILMDIGMPRLNGYETTRRIKEKPWGKDITVIALTGWGQESDREQSRAAGCEGHLVKPVSLSDLEAMLTQTTQQHSK